MTEQRILSRADLDFLLHDWLGVDDLLGRPEFAEHDRDTVDAVLELAEQIATERFAPHNRAADVAEPHVGPDGHVVVVDGVREAIAAFAGAGFIGASVPAEQGGTGLPFTVARAALAWFQAANIGTASYPFLTTGAANLLLAHGTPEQIEAWVPPMLDGRASGTMCLSEPQAGSSLADITTRAEPQPDGTYRVVGTKMWISGGEHELTPNIVHLVLAKIPGGPAGVKGISLIAVPRFLSDGARNDVVLAGVNHKMGYRGTVNTLLNFGESGGAVGWLVGAEHGGLAAMFHMMNEARVGVGMGAAALGVTGYLHSLEYARTRTQGRPVGGRDVTTPMIPIAEHPDVKRMLLAQKAYAEAGMALGLYCSRLVDEKDTAPSDDDRARAALLLDVLTPIAKSWPSQWCLTANDLAIQVLGGSGYTRDFPVEQFYRDNRLNPIHEGTHGIQAIDLLGRKAVMRGGAGLELLLATIRATVGRADAYPEYAAALESALVRVEKTTTTLHAAGDPDVTLANASVYLEAVGHVVVAWIWLEQLLAVDARDGADGGGAFAEGKRAAARYFFRFELPRTGPQFDLLDSLDTTTLDWTVS
ncbi:acyl-CoA dehydrogenase [Actinomycetospora endophytica]|uniref:Acyl-CoA dehydrogenase n=1 Tax=Actinomycetospora endophytica TaxID=2291215 RepID=A0ABS8PB07_9PSEU|nr:acyl-CoA dehydrogenase [Actinomycetospora endophytica]MCD2195456.1 acyl-CoA dehydrogenase [Actinomycetospora endophytica]